MAKYRVVVTHDPSGKHFEAIWETSTPKTALDLTIGYIQKIGKNPEDFTVHGWGYIPDSYNELTAAEFAAVLGELTP